MRVKLALVLFTTACGAGVRGEDAAAGPEDPAAGGIGDDDDADGSEESECPEGGCLDIGSSSWVDCGDDDNYAFNVAWIANSQQGTVSKIDTKNAVELARYRTGPGFESHSPSRTSVNLRGDVAVANRSGSVTKISEKLTRCVDNNGDGMIQTSSGPLDVLPWGEDECVLWHHDIDFSPSPPEHPGGPRAVAWDFSGLNSSDPDASDPCAADLWVGWRDQPSTTTILRRIKGHSGETDVDLRIEDLVGNWTHGAYGGAVDPDGSFWALGTLGTLVRVDGDSLDIDRWNAPTNIQVYGLAIDADGTPWMASWLGHVWKFDLDEEVFVDMGAVLAGVSPERLRGVAIDERGRLWIAGDDPCYLVLFDIPSESFVKQNITLPGCVEPVGVSLDSDGDVWVVDRWANTAYEVHPETYAVRAVAGLVDPYTYSDMTGAGLSLVVPPIE